MADLSVIIPCYRQAHLLPFAIDSALEQSAGKVEIVVVNDGSDDTTEDVSREYGDAIHYVWKENGGLSSARNAGVAAATGRYVLFLDADDMLHPNAVADLLSAVNGRENCIGLMGYRLFENEPEDGPPGVSPSATISSPLPDVINACLGPVHAHLCPRSAVLAAGGFDESLRSCEDWDLWQKLAFRGMEVVSVPLAGAYYRRYPGAMSTNAPRMLRCRTEVLLRAHKAVTSDPRLLSRCGQVLADSEHRIRRNWMAAGYADSKAETLSKCIEELERAGIRPARSWKRRMLEAIPGISSERLILSYFRFCERSTYRHYQQSFN